VSIYAEDPTLPEEEEISAVDKTTIPSAANIAITIIAWTAAPFHSPISTILFIAKDGSRQPLFFPHFNHYFYYIKG
jgi:hypothetical protein